MLQGLAAVARRHLPRSIRAIPRRLVGHAWDFRYGISTEGWYTPTEADREKTRNPDVHMYQPATYEALRAVRDALPLGRNDTLFDLGCGKGRVVCYFAKECRMQRVVGVEFVPELADAARGNARRLRTRSPISIVTGDVLDADLATGTVFFMYEPFGLKTMTAVLEKIRGGLAANPRTVRFACFNVPEPMSAMFAATEWLHLERRVGERVWIWITQPRTT